MILQSFMERHLHGYNDYQFQLQKASALSLGFATEPTEVKLTICMCMSCPLHDSMAEPSCWDVV